MIGSNGKNKVLVMCPYYNSGVFSRPPDTKYSYNINCGIEIKKFKTRTEVNKVYRTYCCTNQFSKCPFYESYVNLIQLYGSDKMSEYKVRDGMYYESLFIDDIHTDFPNIDEDYTAVWDKDLPTRVLHLSEAYTTIEKWHKWTEADDLLLLKTWSTVWNVEDIAARVKRTPTSVNQRLKWIQKNKPNQYTYYKEIRVTKFHHSKNKWLPEKRLEVFTKFNAGSNFKELSEISGRSEKSCRHLITAYKNGVYDKDNWDGSELMCLYKVWYNGGTLREMSEKCFHPESECKLMVKRIENGEFPDLHHQCYPTKRQYNPEEDKQILELKAQGNGFINIAKIMGGNWTRGKVAHRYKTLTGGKSDYGKSRPVSRKY